MSNKHYAKYYQANKDEINERSKAWARTEAGKKTRRKMAKVYKAKNPICIALRDAKYRAKKNQIPFNIKVEDITTPTHCPILGIELDYSGTKTGKLANYNAASLDRIIPELGYVKNNVIVISWRANKIKADSTIDELCKIADFYKQRIGSI